VAKSILLVEDQGLFSQALANLLVREVPGALITEARDARSAIQFAAQLQPQYVLLDVHVPGATGLSLLAEISAVAPDAIVAIITGDESPQLIRLIYDMGGQGYIPKSLEPAALVRACAKFIEQGFYFAPEHMTHMRGAPSRPTLTTRQLEVLALLDEGKQLKQVGAILGITVKTVQRHAEDAYKALNVRNARAACQVARTMGLLRA
jgi:DNA-binding NarL/FixJ family response regulator